MEFPAFERLVARLVREIPEEYLDGIVAVEASPRTVPDPLHRGVFTLGECVPLNLGEGVTSRIVLFHGSFRALAADRGDFAWRDEAWETLLHEVRHHMEWRAHAGALEDYDWAAQQNFARHDGAPFDPLFHRSGDPVAGDVFRVDDDLFVDRMTRGPLPASDQLEWHGVPHGFDVPVGSLPLFLVLEGLTPRPAGEVVVVYRRKPGLRLLFRRLTPPRIAHVRVRPMPGSVR